MPVLKLLSSFNAGELSPRLDARTDIEKYDSGCRILQNFVVTPYGGVNRRPGFVYLGAAKEAESQCRLIPFQFSTTTSFILEFGDEYVRFWSNGAQVEVDTPSAWQTSAGYVVGDFVVNSSVNYYCIAAHTSGSSTEPGVGASWETNWVAQDAYEVPSPYAAEDLFEVQFIQINDVVYLAHQDYPPQKLSRLGDANWTMETVVFDWPALKDENIEATTITSSGTSGSVTLTASADLWNANHVGSYWQVSHIRDAAYVEQTISSNTSSSSLRVLGEWELNTYGTWNAEVLIERSEDDGSTWNTVRTYKSTSDRNVATNGTEEKEVLLRVTVANYSSNTNARARLEVTDARIYGLVRIDSFSSATSVGGTVIKGLESTNATKFWSEPSWSAAAGYPSAIAFHEQRVIYGGTRDQATTFWGSVTGDFENFRRLNLDDSSFAFQLASTQNNEIQWIASQANLLIGTTGDEWVVRSTGEDATVTPSNVKAELQSSYGSKNLQPFILNEALVFVQRLGRKLREFVYSFEPDRFVGVDLTLLSDHITGQGGITQTAFQRQPDSILWCVTSAGTLAGLTYERQQNVVGWHRHVTAGQIESAAVIFDDGTDELWVAVKRTINGSTVRYIERLDPDYKDTQDNEDQDDLIYVDSASTFASGSPTTTVTGLSHLEGATVSVLADGAVAPDKTVSGGQITLSTAASKVQVGLGYTSLIKPMRLEIPLQDGTAQGRHTKVHQFVVRLYKSLGGHFAESEAGPFDQMNFRDTADMMDTPPPLFTGDKELDHESSYDNLGGEIVLQQTEPLPMTILAIVPKFDVIGK